MNEIEKDNLLIKNEHGFSDVEYAGLWIRVGASIIDSFVMIPVVLLTFYNIFSIKSMLFMVVLTILASLYKPLLEWRYGATLGKMACKIKVVNENMGFLSMSQAFGRYLPWLITQILSLISYFYIFNSPNFQEIDGFIEMGAIAQESPLDTVNSVYNFIFLVIVGSLAIDKRKQGFHDKIAGTFCIKVPKKI